MNTPKVSAIITTKNEEKNIGRLLKSIKNQSYRNIETIVVDNKSEDSTKKIALKYTKKVFDKGPERSAQRNYGVSKAIGKYVFILDADMELTKDVVKSCVETIVKSSDKALIVPERTVGKGLMANIRKFEREMYMGDPTVEVARFFDKDIFKKFGGYDAELTGAEDYDLPWRISKKHSIGWSKKYIKHHEGGLTLVNQLKKKYYYASKSAKYAEKHPELVKTQGILIFRKAYLKNWKKFVLNPYLGFLLILLRVLETTSAAIGYLSVVGPLEFAKTLWKAIAS